VGDGFAFAGVFGTVTGVEEAAADGDEGVVVFAIEGFMSVRVYK
jgi:hypothetical protein